MRRRLASGVVLLSLMLLATTAPRGHAQDKPKAPPTWSRLISGKVVVIGQVTAIADKAIEAAAGPKSKDKHAYRIATVKVTDVILGDPTVKEIKVGFHKEGELKVDQEACFILAPHFAQPFLIFPDSTYDLFNTDHGYFELRTKILRHSARCLAAPNELLRSMEDRDRLLTAALLLGRYRDASVGTKTEPIDAEQSKLLLRALRDADWGKEDKSYRLTPQPLFESLGLTAKDGWAPPKDKKGLRLSAENWLIDNQGTYRIPRFVPDPPAK